MQINHEIYKIYKIELDWKFYKQVNNDAMIRVISSFYIGIKVLQVGQKMSAKVDIRRGMREFCILSTLIFNINYEFTFKETLDVINQEVHYS